MNFLQVCITAIALSMDACAVALCNGLVDMRMRVHKAFFIALTFGFFQGLMTIIGYFMGALFSEFIIGISHYVAFGLLLFLGLKMIYEQYNMKEEDCKISDTKMVFVQGIATSIDALLVGITLVMLNVKVLEASIIIGFITFVLCLIAIKIGKKCGKILQKRLILISIGVRILIDGIIN